MNHTLKAEARYWGRSLQQHIPILVTEPWWLPIRRRAPNDLLFISMAFQLILNIYLAQPERSWNVGYSLSRVFLPGASGCTGGFFTQLLFHNPHSFSPIEAINSIAFFFSVCVPQLFKQVLPYPLVGGLFWVVSLRYFGCCVFKVLRLVDLSFLALRVIGSCNFWC